MSEIASANMSDSLRVFGEQLHPVKYFLYPSAPTATDQLISRFEQIRESGRQATLVDGAFDVPHPNHEAYLRHCRLLGAQTLLLSRGQPLNPELISQVLLSDDIHLSVTVDADAKVASKKGGQSQKGGIERPVYPWEARAGRIAGYIFELDGKLRRTADLVTVEGEPDLVGTPFESSLELASFLKKRDLLDNLVVYGEHSSTVNDAERMGLRPLIIPNESTYFINPQTGRDYSSSDLIRRAQGQPVPNPLTRPVIE